MYHLVLFKAATFFALISSPFLWKVLPCATQAPDCEKYRPNLTAIGKWLDNTEAQFKDILPKYMELSFESEINITEDNSNNLIEATTRLGELEIKIGNEANEYLLNNKWLSQCDKNWTRMMKQYVTIIYLIPTNEEKREKLSTLIKNMKRHFSNNSVERENKTYLDYDLFDIMRTSKDPEELLWAWEGWHDLAVRSRDNYTEMISLTNEAGRQHGYKDAGEVWRWLEAEDLNADKDMKELMKEMDPLYKNLHAYARDKIIKKFPKLNLDPNGTIPAHLLGDLLGQVWTGLEDILTPYKDAPPSPNITDALIRQNYTIEKIFHLAETFFVSLGFEPMTNIFWKKSVIRSPDDPNTIMECTATAFDMFARDDYRIKMCSNIDYWSFKTIHHEMGHIAYYMEYNANQPVVFRDGAIPSFHEAIGDTIALSVMSRKHLEKIGLINKTQPASTHCKECDDECKMKINALMQRALDTIVFLPFTLSLELWHFGVFSGEITPDEYNSKWWELRERYQGIAPPVKRCREKFDPGAKFHVLANIKFTRYFYSYIAQFQFHEALCGLAGHQGELYNCDIYESKAAGEKLRSMLSKGSSRPWQELMKDLTGTDKISAKSLMNYFKPLNDWLVEKNKGLKIGWEN